ncbi:MAG: outer membrane lipoprotein-sorting protein [bacterium]|nr:outer membrane lipoprotein-sorting protein [bacterium]
MKMKWLTFLLVAMVGCATPLFAEIELEEEVPEFNIDELSANEILVRARAMFPQERFLVEGELSVERTRGAVESSYPYTLSLDWAGTVPTAVCTLFTNEYKHTALMKAQMTRTEQGEPTLTFINDDGSLLEVKNLNTPVGESDLSWIDLAFDYLWWPNVRKLSEEECEQREIKPRQIGRNCVVLEVYPPVATPGLGSMLLWADRSTGFVIQTQYLNEQGAPVRRLWVQRLGRENGRWVPRLFSVQRAGEKRPRKTHLRIYTITSDHFSVERLEDE